MKLFPSIDGLKTVMEHMVGQCDCAQTRGMAVLAEKQEQARLAAVAKKPGR